MINFRDLKEASPSNRQGGIAAESGFIPKKMPISFRNLTNEKTDEGPKSSNKRAHSRATVSEKDRNSLYEEAHVFLNQVLIAVRQQKGFDLEWGFQIMREMEKFQSTEDTLFLQAIHSEKLYNYVVRHSVNVAIFSTIMAKTMGYTHDQLIEIGMVGLLHDVGIGLVPESIIYKEGRLNDKEFEIMKERCKYGYKILQRFQDPYPYLSECTLQVYERIDGSGYPKGLRADEIHEYAQIVGLAAVYEALIHSRPQREKFLHFVAAKEIIKSGKKSFKTEHLKALLNIFSVFPLQSHVKLNSGAVGKVIATYPDQLMRPKLRILYDSQGRKVLTERIIDLPENPLLYIVDAMAEEELSEVANKHEQMSASPGSMKSRELFTASAGKDVEGSGTNRTLKDLNHRADPSVSAFRSKTPRMVFGIGLLVCVVVAAGWFFRGKAPSEKMEPQPTASITKSVVKTYDIEKSAPKKDRKPASVSSALPALEKSETQLMVTPTPAEKPQEPSYSTAPEVLPSGKPGFFEKKEAPDSGTGLSTASDIPIVEPQALDKTDSSRTKEMSPAVAERTDDRDTDAVEMQPPKTFESVNGASKDEIQSAELVPDMMVSEPVAEQMFTRGTPEMVLSLPPVFNPEMLKPNYPYSVKLTYFKTRDEAENSLDGFRAKGMRPFWVKVNLGTEGIWHRVFAGHFEDKEQGQEFIDRHQLSGVPIKHTRYTTLAGVYTGNGEAEQAIEMLGEKGFSAYSIEREKGQITVHVGAFYTMKGAEEQSVELTAAGIGHHIVER